MSTNQSTTTETTRKPKVRKATIAAVAILLVGALVVSATISPFGSGRDDKHGSDYDDLQAQWLTEEASVLSSVSESTLDIEKEIAASQARIEALLEEQSKVTQEQIDEAMALLQSLISTYGGLAQVPGGYVAGLPVDGHTQWIGGYLVPTLETSVALASFHGQGFVATASQIPSNAGLTGDLPTGDVLQQLEAVNEIITGVLDSQELQEVLQTLEGATGPLPVNLNQLGNPDSSDVEGKIAPHEEGALAALNHAESLLGIASSAYGTLGSEAQAILDSQLSLISALEGIISQTQATVESASSDILDEAAERALATLEEVPKLQNMLQASVDSYLETVTSEVDSISSDIDELIAAQSAALQSNLDKEVARLGGLIEKVETDAQAASDKLSSDAQKIIFELDASGASGKEIEIVMAALTNLQAQVTTQSQAQIDSLEATIASQEELVGEVIDQLSAAQSGIESQIGKLVKGATSEVSARLEYSSALVLATAEVTAEAHRAKALATVASLQERATWEIEELLGVSTQAVEQVHSQLGSVLQVVESAQGDVLGFVGSDLEYILKVAEDYGAAPVGDRADRAAYWQTVHSTVDGTLGSVLVTGSSTIDSVFAAYQAAEQNLQGIELLG